MQGVEKSTLESGTASEGVIYFNRGCGYLDKLLVAVHSLREYWNGNAAIINEGRVYSALRKIAKRYDLQIISLYERGLPLYTAKVASLHFTPFEKSVFLDLDTVVVGELTELWVELENVPFIFTRFHDWITAHQREWGNLKEWSQREILPHKLLKRAVRMPGLNTGVVGFRKGHPFLKRWLRVTQKAEEQGLTVTDEACAQALLPLVEHQIFGPKWNVSAQRGTVNPNNRIIHFHGGSNTLKKGGKRAFVDLWEKTWQKAERNCPEVLEEPTEQRPSVVYMVVAIDSAMADVYHTMAKMCVTSILRTSRAGDIKLVKTSRQPVFSVPRCRVEEINVASEYFGYEREVYAKKCLVIEWELLALEKYEEIWVLHADLLCVDAPERYAGYVGDMWVPKDFLDSAFPPIWSIKAEFLRTRLEEIKRNARKASLRGLWKTLSQNARINLEGGVQAHYETLNGYRPEEPWVHISSDEMSLDEKVITQFGQYMKHFYGDASRTMLTLLES